MSDKAIRDELAKLREQVAALHTTRSEQTAPGPQDVKETNSAPADMAASTPGDTGQTASSAEIEETGDIETQVRDFVDALDEEIKSANPMTVLIVFSLGVLIGRLLPR